MLYCILIQNTYIKKSVLCLFCMLHTFLRNVFFLGVDSVTHNVLCSPLRRRHELSSDGNTRMERKPTAPPYKERLID